MLSPWLIKKNAEIETHERFAIGVIINFNTDLIQIDFSPQRFQIQSKIIN